jgi:hypothetical protein
MTPEQQELLNRKCTKRDLYQANLFKIAIGAAFSGKFSPMDLIDGPISEGNSSDEMPLSPSSPSQRRKKFWGHWKWDIKQLYAFCLERGYEPTLYFETEELEQLQKDFGNDSKN